MARAEADHAPSARPCCPVVELRQYTLHPGARDGLIALFDREFVETQEELGAVVIGQFRDLDAPDRFVWLRGFADMPSRARALASFYGGPAWKAHRDEANATMVDSSDVLLLRPAPPGVGFALEGAARPPPGAAEAPGGLVLATIYALEAAASADFADYFGRDVEPLLAEAGAAIAGRFVTESAPNDFPALPVREGEHVFAWFARFEGQAAYERYLAALGRLARWRGGAAEALARRCKGPPQVLRLSPTARSRRRGRVVATGPGAAATPRR